jgi:raffinose/stachyose/melibiose transport system permease protein
VLGEAAPGVQAHGERERSRSGYVPAHLPYLFLLPAVVLLVWFRYYPALSAVYHSFTDWDGTTPATFIGLAQYQALFQDEVFLQSLRNILVYAAGRTMLTTVMALAGAELVYNLSSGRAQSIWRIIFTIPLVIPGTVILLIWKQVYAGRLGLINESLELFGLDSMIRPWLGQPQTALPALIFVGFPLVAGFGFLVLLAALQNLPPEINDAAMLDGCSRLRQVFSIHLPSILGPLFLVIILEVTADLQEFAPMLVMTGGGPINATLSPGLYLYQSAFTYGKFGYATAIGTLLMLLTLVFSVMALRFRYRRAHDVDV